MRQIQLNKKGSTAGWIIGIIFLIIIIVLIVVGVMVAEQKGWFEKEEPVVAIPTLELFLKANEVNNPQNFFDANVEISYKANDGHEVVAHKGKLNAGAYTPFIVPSDRSIIVRCWDDEHYLVKAIKMHSDREIQENKSVMDCTTAKIGHLEIDQIEGDLGHSFNTVRLNVTAVDGWWYKTAMCYEWTAGIIDVTSDNQWLVCDKGKWLNYTDYHPSNNTYEWLPENEYRCGEDYIEVCTETKMNRCHLPDAIIPYRFTAKVDKCEYIGETLDEGESIEIVLQIPTIDNKNSLDYVSVFFYDFDRRFDSVDNRWNWITAENEINLGAPDQEFTIWYSQN